MANRGPLLDAFGRPHDSVRISVTDRCNLRCFYCLPSPGVKFKPTPEILTLDEIERFVRAAAQLGFTKIRITGGEPLLRPDLPMLVRSLKEIPGIEDLAVTTNGTLLIDHAQELYDAGLRRLNIHLDSLNRARYTQITRRDRLNRVLAGLAVARELGYGPIKINAVAVKGFSEPDVVPLARFGRAFGVEIRYIEFMPLDGQELWDEGMVLPASEIIETLTRGICPLIPIPKVDSRVPDCVYCFADGIGSVGFIQSVTKPFCQNCGRIRLIADGKLRSCLFANEETDIRPVLRCGQEEDIANAIRACVQGKRSGHEIGTVRFVPPPRSMCAIGG